VCGVEPGVVDLWVFPLSLEPADHGVLAPDEAARAGRFHFQRDRDRYVAGRARLRHILGRYLAIPAAGLVFHYGAEGKPRLDGPVFFNLSHSGNLAALAVAPFEVGIDLEWVRPIEEDIAGQFFAPDEVARLISLPPEQRNRAFFTCWTRKEAYIKTRGAGLSLALDAFSVSFGLQEVPRLLWTQGNNEEPHRWQFHHFLPDENAIGAIAARHTAWLVRPRSF
jgi:4'-phosphopantetheinyl transferase